MILEILFFALGVGLLVGGAYYLVEGGSRVAVIMGVPSVVVGLTVVAFGTSAPEFFVSLVGALRDSTELVLGNVIGSNVANIGLILALAAIIRPVVIEEKLPRRELPGMLIASFLFTGLAMNGDLGRAGGLALTALFIGFIIISVKVSPRPKSQVLPDDASVVKAPARSRGRGLTVGGLLVLLGMVGLAAGGHFIVSSATSLAARLGMSEAVIGLTLVAVGTSLPELATTLMAAWRDQDDMALGNIIGSNLFNILGVAGPIAFFKPLIAGENLFYQLLAMMILTIIVCFMVWRKPTVVGRTQGVVLLILYCGTIFMWIR
jgi:cation:H+ antiporter